MPVHAEAHHSRRGRRSATQMYLYGSGAHIGSDHAHEGAQAVAGVLHAVPGGTQGGHWYTGTCGGMPHPAYPQVKERLGSPTRLSW